MIIEGAITATIRRKEEEEEDGERAAELLLLKNNNKRSESQQPTVTMPPSRDCVRVVCSVLCVFPYTIYVIALLYGGVGSKERERELEPRYCTYIERKRVEDVNRQGEAPIIYKRRRRRRRSLLE